MKSASLNSVIAADEQRARRALHLALDRLVTRFGYTLVKGELLKVKRDDERRREQRANKTAAGREYEKAAQEYERLQHIWLTVEHLRRQAQPNLSASAACRKWAELGGIAIIAAGDARLDLGPVVRSRVANAATIEREHKRAEAMRIFHRGINEVWQGLLADASWAATSCRWMGSTSLAAGMGQNV